MESEVRGLAFFQDHIYFTDHGRQIVYRSDLYGARSIYLQNYEYLSDIQIIERNKGLSPPPSLLSPPPPYLSVPLSLSLFPSPFPSLPPSPFPSTLPRFISHFLSSPPCSVLIIGAPSPLQVISVVVSTLVDVITSVFRIPMFPASKPVPVPLVLNQIQMEPALKVYIC